MARIPFQISRIRCIVLMAALGAISSNLSASRSEVHGRLQAGGVLRRSLWRTRGGEASTLEETVGVVNTKNETEEQATNATHHESTSAANKNRKSARKLEFLDRIALISSSLMQESAEISEDEERGKHSGKDITPQSNLSRPGRHIHVVTTASLPWFTGTAVNPLLRAAHLHRKALEINGNSLNQRWVTLVVPWLELPEDQKELYGLVFENEIAQEEYIRTWLAQQGGMPDAAEGLKILWYPARYHSELRSIFAMGDIMSILEGEDLDVCVLG